MNSDLVALDDKFRERFSFILERSFLLFDGIVRYYQDLVHYFNDLQHWANLDGRCLSDVACAAIGRHGYNKN
jgi:hypothetical protein